MQYCQKCAVPPAPDADTPPEYPAYEAPPAFMTFEEYDHAIREAAAEKEAEAESQDLTPEELAAQEQHESVEAFCTEHVPEYAEFMASLQ